LPQFVDREQSLKAVASLLNLPKLTLRTTKFQMTKNLS